MKVLDERTKYDLFSVLYKDILNKKKEFSKELVILSLTSIVGAVKRNTK